MILTADEIAYLQECLLVASGHIPDDKHGVTEDQMHMKLSIMLEVKAKTAPLRDLLDRI